MVVDNVCILTCFVEGYGDHRDLHVLTHSFPTRRSSYLSAKSAGSGTDVPPRDPPEDPPPLELDEEDELELEDVDDDEEPPKLLPPPEELLVLEPPWLQPG